DTINGLDSLNQYPECVKQVAIADRIIVTKSDLVDTEKEKSKISRLNRNLRALNPAAPITVRGFGEFDPDDLFGTGIFDPKSKKVDFDSWINPEDYSVGDNRSEFIAQPSPKLPVDSYYQRQGHTPENTGANHQHDSSIKTFCIVREKPIPMEMLRMFLEGLSKESGPNLLRVKGIINIEEEPSRPAVIQGAQQIFHSLEFLERWPSDNRNSRIVFITRGIEQEYIEDTFSLIDRIAKRTEAAAIV
ncbi:MAG: GTP-binding protein, partial [Pseudomonadota bacterium]|nr:GTP-binding protein [Pseudomonadota bacterium]